MRINRQRDSNCPCCILGTRAFGFTVGDRTKFPFSACLICCATFPEAPACMKCGFPTAYEDSSEAAAFGGCGVWRCLICQLTRAVGIAGSEVADCTLCTGGVIVQFPGDDPHTYRYHCTACDAGGIEYLRRKRL